MDKLTENKKAAFESEVLENWGEPFHDFHGFEDSVNGWQYSDHGVNRIWLSWTKAWDVALQAN